MDLGGDAMFVIIMYVSDIGLMVMGRFVSHGKGDATKTQNQGHGSRRLKNKKK